MVEPLEAILDRLGRAEQHLESIKQGLLSYYNSDPCQMSGEFHPDVDGNDAVEWTAQIAPITVGLNTILGEFLHDLRSALDHLAWQLVLQNKGQTSEETCFPILKVGPTPDKKGQQGPPHIAGGVSPDALAIIECAQPYKWGDAYIEHPLWVLHRLWNIDKHRHVIARGGRTEVNFLGSDTSRFRFTARLESATVDGARLRLVPNDPTVDVDAYLTLEVSIYEPDHGIEAPLMRTLEQILERVVGVVTTAEDRCF